MSSPYGDGIFLLFTIFIVYGIMVLEYILNYQLKVIICQRYINQSQSFAAIRLS